MSQQHLFTRQTSALFWSAITTVLVIKRVLGWPCGLYRVLLIPFLHWWMFRCAARITPSVSKRAKSVNVSFQTAFSRGEIAHLVIDSTGLEGLWWRRMESQKTRQRTPSYMAKVASGSWTATHMKSSVQTCRRWTMWRTRSLPWSYPADLTEKSGQHRRRRFTTPGILVTMNCGVRKSARFIPPRKGAGYWPGEYADRNVQWLISEWPGVMRGGNGQQITNRRPDSGNGDTG